MFIPLHDANPLRTIRAAYVTYTLIAITTASFVLFQSGFVFEAERLSEVGFGVIPAEARLGAGLRDVYGVIPESLTFLTYTFVHAGWAHLIGNMLFLWVFGDNVEDAMGHVRFVLFYFLCGAGAAFTHAVASPDSEIPLVGASGAVAGIVAAYVILHPRVKLWVLLLMRIPVRISAVWAIGGWFLFQVLNLFVTSEHQTAWWAHIGGFATGAILITVMRRPGVMLFDRGLPGPLAER
jgi:membrane associated rhomboid family serine protease